MRASAALPRPGVPAPAPTDEREPYELGPIAMRLYIAAFAAVLIAFFVADEHRRMTDPVERAARGEITAASAESMIQPANLRHALRAVASTAPAGARINSMRLAPASVSADVSTPDGAQTTIRIDAAYKATKETAGASPPAGPGPAGIPVNAPTAILATAATKLHLKPANLDYLTFNTSGFADDGKGTWNAYYSKPLLDNDATAAFDGTDVRLIGSPDAATRKRVRDAAKQADTALHNAALARTAGAQQLKDAQARTRALLKANGINVQ